LPLPVYAVTPRDLAGFTGLLTAELAASCPELILTVTAPVLGYDIEDAYAWRYAPSSGTFTPVDPATAYRYLHEDTKLVRHPSLGDSPYPGVSALEAADAAAQDR
ncbi:hypothetical protein ABZW18_31575, partial [Streptomyces sp. NPDC004647]|uniref:hypothetical protein n=1 Tax=Streptomyces sp. NPDC004647 TaxID=3154671 RepID=UPI0033A2727E